MRRANALQIADLAVNMPYFRRSAALLVSALVGIQPHRRGDRAVANHLQRDMVGKLNARYGAIRCFTGP